MNNKNDIFSYVLTQLVNWYKEVKEVGEEEALNHFSKLSVLKLLFFIAAVPNKTKENDLLDIFDDFSALPYGPVESEIYNAICQDQIPKYTIGGRFTAHNSTSFSQELDLNTKNRINKSIASLRLLKPEMITLGAFELVDETHKWPSWSDSFNLALILGTRSTDMNAEDIRKDAQIYFS